MENEKTIHVLNDLVEINNDRIDGYETASEETEEADLKALFFQFGQTSMKCKDELAQEIVRLGGKPTESTRVSGKFFRVWMDLKAALTGKNRKLILESCEYGEEAAQKSYIDALNARADHLSTEQKSMLGAQLSSITADHMKVKSMITSLT
ncbi:ferritin-like domain-containing protein [Flavobacterium sp. LB3P122]|uniref:ferritin-like domain-containing protein n=1 Tax=Flavobacterium algoriphilum TaxID=3398738 RepID=UPI003A8B56AA